MIAPWFALDFSGADAESRLRRGREGVQVIWSATGTRSSVVLDIDRDGDLDIVTNEFNTHPQVFRNESKPKNYLQVKLEGISSGTNALGAIVVVETAAGQQRQVNNGASGYISQSVMPLYFGLGDHKIVNRLIVIWPDGHEQEVAGPVAINTTVKVIQNR